MSEISRTKAGNKYFTETEEKKLFRTIKSRKGKQAERDYVLLKLGRETALRRGELLALDVSDVRDKSVLIVDPWIARKGGLGEVYLTREMQKIISRFLHLKRKWGESLEDEAPLFVSRKGKRMAARTFNDLMTKWCGEAGIPRYTPHALRHTKAQRIMAAYWNLPNEKRDKKREFVQKQLRHKSFNSTAIYTAPTKEDMMLIAGI